MHSRRRGGRGGGEGGEEGVGGGSRLASLNVSSVGMTNSALVAEEENVREERIG